MIHQQNKRRQERVQREHLSHLVFDIICKPAIACKAPLLRGNRYGNMSCSMVGTPLSTIPFAFARTVIASKFSLSTACPACMNFGRYLVVKPVVTSSKRATASFGTSSWKALSGPRSFCCCTMLCTTTKLSTGTPVKSLFHSKFVRNCLMMSLCNIASARNCFISCRAFVEHLARASLRRGLVNRDVSQGTPVAYLA